MRARSSVGYHFALIVVAASAWSCGVAQERPTTAAAQAGSAPYGPGAESYQSVQGGGNWGLGPNDVSMSGGKCSAAVKDAQVTVEDTRDGVALAFVAPPSGDVGALRQAVRDMARHHALRSQFGWGGGRGRGQGAGLGPMPPVTAMVQDLEGGARIVFTPTDAAKLGALRQAAYERQALLESGSCPLAGSVG